MADPAIPTLPFLIAKTTNMNRYRFLDLPVELRNIIYSYSIQWPNFSEIFNEFSKWKSYKARCDEEKRTPLSARPSFEEMRTPTILLLNRKITAEALVVLYGRPFVLTSPSPHPIPFSNPVYITEFISEATLRNVRTVALNINLNYTRTNSFGDANGWTRTVTTLFEVWKEKNSLIKVEVHAQYVEPSRALGWTFAEVAHHRSVVELMSQLREFGRNVPVTIEGNFPTPEVKV